MPRKRKADDVSEDIDVTPKKPRISIHENTPERSPSTITETPSKRNSILKKTPSKANGRLSVGGTPSSLRKVLFSTPGDRIEPVTEEEEEHTPTAIRNDRSALKKSRRTLLTVTGEDDSGDEDHEAIVARAILNEEEEELDEGTEAESSAPNTPSKNGRPRGRPKGRRRERTPSPPPDLPPHEQYFFQNRPGASKTSANTLPFHLLLSAEDYYTQVTSHPDHHDADFERLKQLHIRAFDQWIFELNEGFNLCFYGYGSKRDLLMDFAAHLHRQTSNHNPRKIVIVNGYAPGLTIKDILTTVASALFPKTLKLPAQPRALLDLILLSVSDPSLSPASPSLPTSSRVAIIIHSLDHANLRKPTTQSMLARLAAHPHFTLIASCDQPNFPLLWDVALARHFRFLFHDATTFQPYRAELDVVEDVNALLGRSRRSLSGKDGVGYVLKSLPENARNLFRILVAEQLALADAEGADMMGEFGGNGLDSEEDEEEDGMIGVENEDDAAEEEEEEEQETPSRTRRGRPPKKKATKKKKKSTRVTLGQQKTMGGAPVGVEYRTLYHKAVEEFVCSSEVNFRTLLKEFHDHQMIESRSDAMGTERLIVPFRREELETILEDLV